MIRLLFDENLSPGLKYVLRDIYPQSLHVFDIGLDEVDDPAIWEYAKDVGYMIVTKDSDFLELSHRLGHSPKVVVETALHLKWKRYSARNMASCGLYIEMNRKAIRK